MSWERLWLYFMRSSNEIKRSIWEQLNLVEFLKALPPGEQNAVMKHAPDDVRKYTNKLLGKPAYKSKLLMRLERN